MPLFRQHPTAYSPDQAFTNLFRLIDGFDAYSREVGNDAAIGNNKVATRGQPGTTSLRAFNPRFDVRETENTYELHGELPGLDRNNVTIEFSEPQTLVVSGRIERNYEEEQPETPSEKAAPVSPSLKATVADETETGDVVLGEGDSKKEVSASTAKPVRYWYRERSIGSFRRAFEFPTAVDEDAVKAGLDNGVLNISIPKAVKRQTKKISIS